MRKCLALVALAAIFLTSCENTWDSDAKEAYKQSCLESATWLPTDAEKNEYCECVLERTMEKYPNVADLLENADKVADDPDIQACKTDMFKD